MKRLEANKLFVEGKRFIEAKKSFAEAKRKMLEQTLQEFASANT